MTVTDSNVAGLRLMLLSGQDAKHPHVVLVDLMGRVVPRQQGTPIQRADRSDRVSPLNDADQHERNRHNQQNVNEAAERCRCDHAEEPQDEKKNKNGCEHG